MEKILYVEDDLSLIDGLKYTLEVNGYSVDTARTVKQALAVFRGNSYQLLLLDVTLPDGSGFDVCKEVRKSSSVPIIFLTASDQEISVVQGLDLGGDDYITKPFKPLIIKARVDTHIKLYDYRRQVEQQSMTDQLTGIANRRRYERYSIMKWDEAVRLHVPFSVCIFDIDRFKAYNDTFGHPAGDKVIAAVAKTAASHMQRSTDLLARYGGEEFVAIFLEDSAAESFGHLKKIRQAVEDLHIPHAPAVSQWVTVSIGGTTVIPDAEDCYASYLKIADTMLYDAKRHGRNQVVWADERMEQLWEV